MTRDAAQFLDEDSALEGWIELAGGHSRNDDFCRSVRSKEAGEADRGDRMKVRQSQHGEIQSEIVFVGEWNQRSVVDGLIFLKGLDGEGAIRPGEDFTKKG